MAPPGDTNCLAPEAVQLQPRTRFVAAPDHNPSAGPASHTLRSGFPSTCPAERVRTRIWNLAFFLVRPLPPQSRIRRSQDTITDMCTYRHRAGVCVYSHKLGFCCEALGAPASGAGLPGRTDRGGPAPPELLAAAPPRTGKGSSPTKPRKPRSLSDSGSFLILRLHWSSRRSVWRESIWKSSPSK